MGTFKGSPFATISVRQRESRIAARERIAASGLCEPDSPRSEHEQWQVIDCVVQPASESADKLMLFSIVADSPVLFGKGRIDRHPMRERPAFRGKTSGDTARHELIQRLEDRHRLDPLLMIDSGGRHDNPYFGEAEVTE